MRDYTRDPDNPALIVYLGEPPAGAMFMPMPPAPRDDNDDDTVPPLIHESDESDDDGVTDAADIESPTAVTSTTTKAMDPVTVYKVDLDDSLPLVRAKCMHNKPFKGEEMAMICHVMGKDPSTPMYCLVGSATDEELRTLWNHIEAVDAARVGNVVVRLVHSIAMLRANCLAMSCVSPSREELNMIRLVLKKPLDWPMERIIATASGAELFLLQEHLQALHNLSGTIHAIPRREKTASEPDQPKPDPLPLLRAKCITQADTLTSTQWQMICTVLGKPCDSATSVLIGKATKEELDTLWNYLAAFARVSGVPYRRGGTCE